MKLPLAILAAVLLSQPALAQRSKPAPIGFPDAPAKDILESLVPAAHAQAKEGAAFKVVEGTGALCFAEQLIASGVKYVFGNSASEDAQFYEALVDRPQLKRSEE